MRVGFDEQIFLLQKRGGVSRYFVELIREFASNSSYGIEPVVDFKSTSNEMLFGLSEELGLGLTFDRRKKPLSLASESAKSLLNLTNVDLIHHTFYSKLFWQPRFSGPRVSTHYDMIPELYKERRFFVNPHLSKKFYFENVNYVLAISDSAKSDLLSIWPDIDTSISVTHLASRETPNLSAKRVRGNVLFVGVRHGYKDAGTLINAFAKVPENLRGSLIFAGGGPFTQSEKALFAELRISHLVSQSDLSDLELSAAYSSAHVFVFPSRYEGFGLPILEAFQHQCRTLLSGTAVFNEIAGNSAEYFPPGDDLKLSRMLTEILLEDPNTNPYAKSGLRRAQEFTWSNTARLTAEIYKSLLIRC
jgi:glycosyltransferase involved in cell wall biosynthesis